MRLTLEPLDVERDLALLHAWVTHPRSVYWQMQGATMAEVAREYAAIAADPHHHAWLGRADGEPQFLAETYDPRHGALADRPEIVEGDLGMHLLVAPPTEHRAGFTTAVFGAVMDFCFKDPAVRRVVVEPDVRNDRIAALNAAAGFVVECEIELHDKTAALSFCTRAAYSASGLDTVAGAPYSTDETTTVAGAPYSTNETPTVAGAPYSTNETTTVAGAPYSTNEHHSVVAHLTPENLAVAQRSLVCKAIAEFSHERLLTPLPRGTSARGTGGFGLDSPDGSVRYEFSAHRHALEHWSIDRDSLVRTVGGVERPLDVQQFLVEFAPLLGIPDALLPTYLEELASTLASAAWKLAHSTTPVEELVHADHQTLEAAMTEGHPAFVANNGRIGYGGDDYAAYAPETGRAVRLVWVAVRRSLAELSLGDGLTEEELYRDELGEETLRRFAGTLTDLGLEPGDHLLLPLHPWQWVNRVMITFAPDVARRDIVFLGEGDDDYRAQQSIRTFFNTSTPDRMFVKTALAIQNMGFLRGLSPGYMAVTPAINDWVHDLVEADEELVARGFRVLRECAAIGYTGDAFHALGFTSPYQKMLAALWRESPVPHLAEGDRLATMASLLHRDAKGSSLVEAMISESGRSPRDWLASYLDAYLRPLVHCLLRYDLAFMPHGENLVMVVRDHTPVAMFMKDIGEEVAVMGDLPLPEAVERIRATVPVDEQSLAIHTDVFDGFFRHLAAILDDDGVLPGADFWDEVRACLDRHLADHPELAGAAARHDLTRATFRHSCLNRLQLRNTLQMVDLADQSSSLMFAGELANPVAAGRFGG